uniref:Uncharacterized protein n=1 Tax=Arion vulgaris TaxID=1028688 RepID=A0A0B7ABG7_9EUPU
MSSIIFCVNIIIIKGEALIYFVKTVVTKNDKVTPGMEKYQKQQPSLYGLSSIPLQNVTYITVHLKNCL